ncbi:hepatitis A virus cellular receptor 2-like [Erethizon dorsatum]
MFSHLSFERVLLLLLLLLTRSLEEVNIVELGQNAQLPCTYSLPTSGGLVPVCWGKGACPVFNCKNVVLRTDERNVIYRISRRYRLQGNFSKGDVSLTIMNVTLDDSGTYCCRVQFPGPMNDDKFNMELVIRPFKVIPAPTAQGDRTATLPRMPTTEGHGSETQTLGRHHEKNQTQTFTLAREFQASEATTRIGVYIGAGVSAGVALVFILGALILLWYSHKKKNLQNASLITLANLPASGFANAVAEGIRSEENIYTIENIYSTEENIYTIENIYSTEENIYEVEDPDERYCSVSRGQRA